MSAPEVCAYLALGSNLGPSERLFDAALAELERQPLVWVEARSRWARTAPEGPGQPAFLNGAARLRTSLPPHTLLALLKAIERRLGRAPGRARWGPRPLDLDLISYGSLRLRSARLELPHPRAHLRPFVTGPLGEVMV